MERMEKIQMSFRVEVNNRIFEGKYQSRNFCVWWICGRGISVYLWENFRQLWMEDNGFSAMQISSISSIGMFFCGLMYEKGLRYMFGLSAFFMMFQISLAYGLIYMRKHRDKVSLKKKLKMQYRRKDEISI